MVLSKTAVKVLDDIRALPVVDSHEHLVPEPERVAMPVDVFTLFTQYSKWDLIRAGMPSVVHKRLYDTTVDLEERWRSFRSYWELIRFGSFSRASLLSVRRLFGIDDISDSTYRTISESMQRANVPGLYDRVLREASNVDLVLDQCQKTRIEPSYMKPIMYAPLVIEDAPFRRETLEYPYFLEGRQVNDYDEYLSEVRRYLYRVHAEGSLAFKVTSYHYKGADDAAAREAFESLRTGRRTTLPRENPLTDRVLDIVLEVARDLNIPVAVHCGYWNDFRESDPLYMIPVVSRNPDIRFDLYHLGVPWSRETLFIAKNYENVWINFCWAHAISQRVSRQALDEALDLIPTNKLLAFGGDYLYSVENVYGHLELARENIAATLAERIDGHEMTPSQAIGVAERWLSTNARELYRLSRAGYEEEEASHEQAV